jgi:hypothetical protein
MSFFFFLCTYGRNQGLSIQSRRRVVCSRAQHRHVLEMDRQRLRFDARVNHRRDDVPSRPRDGGGKRGGFWTSAAAARTNQRATCARAGRSGDAGQRYGARFVRPPHAARHRDMRDAANVRTGTHARAWWLAEVRLLATVLVRGYDLRNVSGHRRTRNGRQRKRGPPPQRIGARGAVPASESPRARGPPAAES